MKEHGKFIELSETPLEARQFLYRRRIKHADQGNERIRMPECLIEDFKKVCDALEIDFVIAFYEKE